MGVNRRYRPQGQGPNLGILAGAGLVIFGMGMRFVIAGTSPSPPDPVVVALQAENAKLTQELDHANNKIASQKDTIDTLVIDVRTNKQAKEAMQSAFGECQKVVARKRMY